jgi:hypothetical protein
LRDDGIDVETLAAWHRGIYLKMSDADILEAAFSEARTLVTFDCKTIPGLLRVRNRAGRSHGGVILVDHETIRQDDIGGPVRALSVLLQVYGDESWTDWCLYLTPA